MAQSQTKTRTITEYGDFQTPAALALTVTEKLREMGLRPRSILEPTCGQGAFVAAVGQSFPDASTIIGVDINSQYVEKATSALLPRKNARHIQIEQGDFFAYKWEKLFAGNEGPWLIIGNPPWVTSSSLGTLDSANLPAKSNFEGRTGIEAITGKSNFDISEFMLLRYLDWLKGSGTIAVLCKTAVARKIVNRAWKQGDVKFSRIYKIDAMAHFGAAVDACLLVIDLEPRANCKTCEIFDTLSNKTATSSIAFCKGHLVTGRSLEQLEELWGPDIEYAWRSGIKHDCSRVMELFQEPFGYRNGLGEQVDVEDAYLYPMLKGSDIGNGRIAPRGKMIVTQEIVGQATAAIASNAPNTWKYLNRHQTLLNARGSVIYKNKPEFSIFGVGPYTFAPWKLAVSAFYKKLLFVPVGPVGGRAVVFDDTVYFLPCASESEAIFLKELLHSDVAKMFLNSMIHWSDKRPLTVDLLKRLSLKKLAAALGRETEYDEFVRGKNAENQQRNLPFAS